MAHQMCCAYYCSTCIHTYLGTAAPHEVLTVDVSLLQHRNYNYVGLNLFQESVMSLCHVCLKVPFFSLPKPAPANLYSYVGNNQDMIQACGQSKDGDSDIQRLPDVVGVPFHENLETLALSAESCPLCFIVHVGVQKWINGWKHAAQNQPAFNEFQKERAPLPTKQPLVLSQCVSGPLGFLLWARNPSSDKLLYLLTAVGLSVEACESLPLCYETIRNSHS